MHAGNDMLKWTLMMIPLECSKLKKRFIVSQKKLVRTMYTFSGSETLDTDCVYIVHSLFLVL